MLRMRIEEVCETSDFKHANQLLQQGWKLMDIYHGDNCCVYVLCFIDGNGISSDN